MGDKFWSINTEVNHAIFTTGRSMHGWNGFRSIQKPPRGDTFPLCWRPKPILNLSNLTPPCLVTFWHLYKFVAKSRIIEHELQSSSVAFSSYLPTKSRPSDHQRRNLIGLPSYFCQKKLRFLQIRHSGFGKLASLEATLVRNSADWLTDKGKV